VSNGNEGGLTVEDQPAHGTSHGTREEKKGDGEGEKIEVEGVDKQGAFALYLYCWEVAVR
jgi:hypothetical protein